MGTHLRVLKLSKDYPHDSQCLDGFQILFVNPYGTSG